MSELVSIVLKSYERDLADLQAKLGDAFDKAIAYVLSDIKNHISPDIALARLIELEKQWGETLFNFSVDYFRREGVIDFIGLTENKLRENAFVASHRTMERIRGDIKSEIAHLSAEGVNAPQMVIDLREFTEGLQDWEIARITQTELGSAQNAVDYEYYSEDPFTDYLEWVSYIDDKTRDSHIELNGQIIRIGDRFSNGLRYPGDRDGTPIEEWINCRCAEVAFDMPPGYIAPPGLPYFYEYDIIKVD